MKRCHKTIKGFSYPLAGTLLKDIPYFGQLLAPMSRNDIDAIGDKFCPLSKDQVLELGLHTLWQKKISEKDEKYLITFRRDKNCIGVFTFIARCNFHGTFP